MGYRRGRDPRVVKRPTVEDERGRLGKEKEEGEEGATTRERKRKAKPRRSWCAALWCSTMGWLCGAVRCAVRAARPVPVQEKQKAEQWTQRPVKGSGRATQPMGSGPLWPWGVGDLLSLGEGRRVAGQGGGRLSPKARGEKSP